MSKVMVIKGANFQTNALGRVEFIDSIPCTGVTLSANTLTTQYLLTPQTLTATITPLNTTDELFWASSDETIATVIGGVIMPLKPGNVRITARCGIQSATCNVTVQGYIDTKLRYMWYYNRRDSAGKYLPDIKGGDNTTSYGGTYNDTGSGLHAMDYDKRLPTGTYLYPIMIPEGAVKLKLTLPNQSIKSSFTWCNTSDEAVWSGVGGYIATSSWEGTPWNGVAGTRTVTIPTGTPVDCFFLSLYLSGDITAASVAATTVEALFE